MHPGRGRGEGAGPDGSVAGEGPRLARSRTSLLSALGDSRDVTFVRSAGNLGDELIWAGTRRLLSGRPFREVGLSEALGSEGDVAVLSGGGAWSDPYHELLPPLLGSLEERFARVVVFPSSFDPSVLEVRNALSRTRSVVFAREKESLHRIRDLCDARLADDAAFFFDFSPYRGEGSGILQAFRTDHERSVDFSLPPGNRDISVGCSSLDEWLWAIARHAEVRTDRAHVMIAAALLGKRVRYRSSSYFKLPAIAAFSLQEYPVVQDDSFPGMLPAGPRVVETEQPRLHAVRVGASREGPRAAAVAAPEPRVTAIILTTNRPGLARAAAASILENAGLPCRVLLVPNGSSSEVQRELDLFAAPESMIECLPLAENLGAAGGRAFATGAATSEFVFFLDDDAEIFPGALARLVAELDAHPEALAVTPAVVLPDGKVQHCGGEVSIRGGAISFLPFGKGLAPGDPALGGPSRTGWMPSTAALIRLGALLEFPLDLGMRAYYEDNEWSWRVTRSRPAAFRRVPEAVALHHLQARDRRGDGNAEIARLIPYLEAIARFRARHGYVLEAVFGWLPELRRRDGTPDVSLAADLLGALSDSGSTWFLEAWGRAEGHGGLLRQEVRARRDSGSQRPIPVHSWSLREIPGRLRRAAARAAGLGEA
ncbi:MAG: glycosyltransferase [Thermoanaerobaculia bacterium]